MEVYIIHWTVVSWQFVKNSPWVCIPHIYKSARKKEEGKTLGQDPYYNIPGYLIFKEQQTIVKQSKKYLSADPEDIISPSGDQEHLIKF